MALGGKLMALMPIMLIGLKLLVFKALIVSKLAFFMALMLSASKLMGGGGGLGGGILGKVLNQYFNTTGDLLKRYIFFYFIRSVVLALAFLVEAEAEAVEAHTVMVVAGALDLVHHLADGLVVAHTNVATMKKFKTLHIVHRNQVNKGPWSSNCHIPKVNK